MVTRLPCQASCKKCLNDLKFLKELAADEDDKTMTFD
jgi:hypothetical protein